MTESAQNTCSRKQLDMQLISARTIAFLESESLVPGEAREALFRANGDRFVLYLSDARSASLGEERAIFLDLREALLWLNEPFEQRGSFWI